jgi:plasmid maintenance system killer protein
MSLMAKILGKREKSVLLQHSIRINDQYRICFVGSDAGASQVAVLRLVRLYV